MIFHLVTFHLDGMRVQDFPTWEAAKAVGDASGPDNDGSVFPSAMTDEAVRMLEQENSWEYQSGLFFADNYRNRFGAIFSEVEA